MAKIEVKWAGIEALQEALKHKSQINFDAAGIASIASMFARAKRPGGTPYDTGELRGSVRFGGNTMGYLKEYAPHVEYGHRTRKGSWVPGQYYLKRNVDTERPLYAKRLKRALEED